MKKIYFVVIAVLSLHSSFAANVLTFDPPSFSYENTDYCQSSPEAFPIFSPGSNMGGLFSASPVGMMLHPVTGAINFFESVPGTYTVSYSTPPNGEEPGYEVTTVIVIAAAIHLQPIEDVNACVFYVLPALVQGNYFSGPNGTGTPYFAGNFFTNTTTIYVYAAGSGVCPDDEESFQININTIDITVAVDGNTLTANQEADLYQWAICADPPVVIPGATTQSFTPSENGNYIVLISVGDCDAYSWCTSVTGLEIADNSLDNISIYPNPAKDHLLIGNLPNTMIDSVAITDINGRLVTENTKFLGLVDVSGLREGIYFLQIYSGDKTSYRKFIKQ
ncbi:MAG: T9SS type A sorting domain-containing protein [Flavobacterium sp.]|nr:T9SS type A sorting domain-containing protein [Flavobacterium sp.]